MLFALLRSNRVESQLDIEKQSRAHRMVTLMCATILYYDYFLTLPGEVSRFWSQRKFSWVAFTFFLNRYLSLFGTIAIVFKSFWDAPGSPQKSKICTVLNTYQAIYLMLIQLVVAIMLVMRTYALFDRSRWVAALLSIVITAAIGVGVGTIFVIRTKVGVIFPPPQVGCTIAIADDGAGLVAASWGGMLVFDVLVFSLTLWKAIALSRLGRDTLLNVVLRDGSVYFGVIVALNLVNIFSLLYRGTRIRGVSTLLLNVVSSVLMTRFMLNLRDPVLLGRGVIPTTRVFSREEGEIAVVSTVDPESSGFTGITDYDTASDYPWTRQQSQFRDDIELRRIVPKS